METKHPEIPEPLIEAVRRREVILFAGGGISQNLGLPDLRTLIQYLAEQLGMSSDGLSLNDYPVIAEAYVQSSGKLGALRSWMDTTWHPSTTEVAHSDVHNLIVDLDFSTIYTTNYDRWLEKAYEARGKSYRKITNVGDLTHPLDGATEVIKFHGDFEDDASLVLTEANYFRRMSFETPLDIRLRADSRQSAMRRLEQSDFRVGKYLDSAVLLHQALDASGVDGPSRHESRCDVGGCHREIDAIGTLGRQRQRRKLWVDIEVARPHCRKGGSRNSTWCECRQTE